MCVASKLRAVYHCVLPSSWAENGVERIYTSPADLWKVEFQKYLRPISKCLLFLVFLSGHLHRVSPVHQQTR